MAVKRLGEQIDVHGGGTDLIFPHHENEIAQTESLTGRPPFARYWVHTGMMSLPAEEGTEGPQKIAHSGKFITIRGTLEGGDIPAPALRTYLLSLRYRDTLVFSEEALRATAARWRRWVETRATLTRLLAWAEGASGASASGTPSPPRRGGGGGEVALAAELAHWKADFLAAMDDDFNTSRALSALDELVHAANVYTGGLGGEPSPATANALRQALAALEELTGVLGIALEETVVADALSDQDVKAIEALLAEREAARAAKNWPEADRIRTALDAQYHVVIKDTPQGATWSVKR
jgi:cysteinyl-tRNA synthetase